MSDDRYRFSFETVAEQYERARPPYAAAAVAWVAERLGIGAGSRVLDLAAGTGKLTRQLGALGADVVAVEPGDEMRRVLVRAVPGVDALAGLAEAIPLPDASVDAVAVGQAFHWFETRGALAEMHRVLRPRCGVALLWNDWDEDDPLLGPIDAVLNGLRSPESRDALWESDWDAALFTRPERRAFRQVRELSADALVAWAALTSGFVNASRAEQRRVEREIRRLARGHDGAVAIRTDVVVAFRLS